MAWRGRAVTGAFTSDTEVAIATKGTDESVLTSLSFRNDTALDLDILIRHKTSGAVYSGAHVQKVLAGASFEADKMPEFTMGTAGDTVVATFGAGQVFTGRFQANVKDWEDA